MTEPPPSAKLFHIPPPHGFLRDFLGKKTVERFLHFALDREPEFVDGRVGYDRDNSRSDQTVRISKVLFRPQPIVDVMAPEITKLVPEMCLVLGIAPFSPSRIEIELVSHADGARFTKHIDTHTGALATGGKRVISAVYYFNKSPKAFSGGVLRLHSLRATGLEETYTDIEPISDTLVFFPSWFPHEVLPVHCSSGRFCDSRFAINCWIYSGGR